MKECFIASICVHGVLGGAVYLVDDGFLFRCQKATLEAEYKNLWIPYKNIESISAGKRVLFIPTTVIETKGGRTYRFLILNGKKFKRYIQQLV